MNINHPKYEAVIGLEVHAQLMTHSKAFSSDSTEFGSSPNTNVSVITLGHPGTLPRLNERAVEFAIKMGLACNCTIRHENHFARKNYFYPDLPKGYQITQHTTPICYEGFLNLKMEGYEKRVGITRIHIEEDAGKSLHDQDPYYTLIDLNRAGVPLIEIVSEPDMRTPEEAYAYLSEIRKMVRYLDICDGNMEEGSLRCDANVSVRLKGAEKFGAKVEVKNMNSIRNVKRALEHEIERQIKAVEAGEKIAQDTRSFDAVAGITFSMRSKEMANDYRYFPEPDLPPVILTDKDIAQVRNRMPELPEAMKQRFISEGLSEYDASILTEDKQTAFYFEEVRKISGNIKAAANWVMGPVRSYCNENAVPAENFPLKAGTIADIIKMIEAGQINFTIASQQLFPSLIKESGKISPTELAKQMNLIQQSDEGLILQYIEQALAKYPDKVQEYKTGKTGIAGLFMGEVMKLSKGKADPKLTNKLLSKVLNEPIIKEPVVQENQSIKVSMGLKVPFSLLFPNEANSKVFSDYLFGMGKEDLIKECIWLLNLNARGIYTSSWESLIRIWFHLENNSTYLKIVERLREIERKYGKIKLLSSETSLSLLEYVLENCSTLETTIDKYLFEENLLKAYTLLNETIDKKEKALELIPNELNQGLRLAVMGFLQTFPYSDYVNYDLRVSLVSQFIKAFKFLEYIENHPQLSKAFKIFLKENNFVSKEEYLKNLMFIAKIVHDKEYEKDESRANQPIILNVQNDNLSHHSHFLDGLSINLKPISSKPDFINIRNYPLFKEDSNNYRVIYPLFIVEKLHKSLYFGIKSIVENNKTEFENFNFRSTYTYGFSEKILSYEFIEKLTTDADIKLNGNELDKYSNGQIDYYARFENSVFLFESKDVLIPGDNKTRPSYVEFEKLLRKKFYKDGESRKAILQLIENIKRVTDNSNSFDTIPDMRRLKIYPIVVLHDYSYNCLGLNYWINTWFFDELKNQIKDSSTFSKIAPLVIVDIDTLIFTKQYFQDRNLKIEEAILQYLNYTHPQSIKSESDIYQTIMPFSQYLIGFLEKKFGVTITDDFIETGKKLFLKA